MKRLALIPVLALLTACGDKPPAVGGPQMPPPTVLVAPVTERVESEWIQVSGRVEPMATVEVRSRVAGAVQEVAFTEGALVKPGDLLVAIDARPFQAAVLRAEAEVANATARLGLAQRDAARSQELLQAEAISKEGADQRDAAVAIGTASLRAAEAALTTAKLDIAYARITAPIAGRVGRAAVTVGNLTGVGTQVLTTIVTVDPVYVTFDLDERTFAKARALLAPVEGREPAQVEVGLEGQDGFPQRARVDFIDNRIDAQSGTIRIRAVLANADGAIVPGGFARVRLAVSAPAPRVLVDQKAISTDQGRKYVLVLGEGNIAGYRPIVLGDVVGESRVVRDGLKPGETVIFPGKLVFPGMPVAPQTAEQAAAAAAPAPSPAESKAGAHP